MRKNAQKSYKFVKKKNVEIVKLNELLSFYYENFVIKKI